MRQRILLNNSLRSPQAGAHRKTPRAEARGVGEFSTVQTSAEHPRRKSDDFRYENLESAPGGAAY